MIDIRDSEISRDLLEIGEYGYQEMLQWFEHLSIPSNSKTLIDIGANIGTTAIPMALDKRFVKIFSFEPDPYNYSMLDFNIKRNGLCNSIIPNNIAIGDRDGCIPFELSPSNFGDHRVRYQENKDGLYNEQTRDTIEVPMKTLDTVFNQQRIEPDQVALIKSDTQGSEGHILRGAEQILRQKMIPWVIEFWPYGLDRSQIKKEEFCKIVVDSFSNIIEFRKNKTMYNHAVTQISELFKRYTGDSWCNLLLIP